jgi:hypothetical protein
MLSARLLFKWACGVGAMGEWRKPECKLPKMDVNSNLICKLGNGSKARGRFLGRGTGNGAGPIQNFRGELHLG